MFSVNDTKMRFLLTIFKFELQTRYHKFPLLFLTGLHSHNIRALDSFYDFSGAIANDGKKVRCTIHVLLLPYSTYKLEIFVIC